MEKEKSATKIIVPSKDIIQNWWELKSFSDKQKLGDCSTTKSALQQMLNGLKVKKYKWRNKIYKIDP